MSLSLSLSCSQRQTFLCGVCKQEYVSHNIADRVEGFLKKDIKYKVCVCCHQLVDGYEDKWYRVRFDTWVARPRNKTRARWRAMAGSVAGGESLDSVASRLGVSLDTVKRGCKENGVDFERCGSVWVVCRSSQLYTGRCFACNEKFGMKERAVPVDRYSVPPVLDEFAYCWDCAEEKLRGIIPARSLE